MFGEHDVDLLSADMAVTRIPNFAWLSSYHVGRDGTGILL